MNVLISANLILANKIRLIHPEQALTDYVKAHRRIRQLSKIVNHYEKYSPPNLLVDDLMGQLMKIHFGKNDIVGKFLLFQQVDVFVEDYCKKLESL